MGYCKVFIVGVLLFFLMGTSVWGQDRFAGGIVLGANASQLDGDQSAGYNKFGLSAGIRGIILLGDKKDVSIDLLYSQQGSQSTVFDPVAPFTFRLDYLEIPVIFNYGDWEKTTRNGRKYYKVRFSGGLSYGRLFSASVDSSFLAHHPPLSILNKNSVSVVLGVAYFMSPHMGIGVKWTTAVTDLFHAPSYKNDPILGTYESLRGYFWTLYGIYVF